MTTRSRLAYETNQFGNQSLSPSGWRSGVTTPTWSVDSTALDGPSGASWTDNGDGSFSSFLQSGVASATQTLIVKFKLDNPDDVFAAYNGIDKDNLWLRIHDMTFRPRVTVTQTGTNTAGGGLGNLGIAVITVSNGRQWNGSPPSREERTYRYGKSINNSFTMPFNDRLGNQGSYSYIGQDVLQQVETNIGSKTYAGINIGQSTFATQRPFEQFTDPDNLFIKYQFNNNGGGIFNIGIKVEPKFDVHYTSPSQIYRWYALAHDIDGQDGDTIGPMTVDVSFQSAANHIFIGQTSVSTTTTLTEQSANKKFCPATTMSAGQSNMTVTPSFILGTTLTKQVNTVLQGTTENFVRMDPLTINGSTSLTSSTAFKLSTASLTIASQTQSTFGSNMIFDVFTEYNWDSFNLNTYFELGYAQGQYALEQGEYTWDFTGDFTWDTWASVTWVGNEASWDNWPDDVWDRKAKFETQGELSLTPTFKVGQPVTVNSQVVLASTPGFNIPLPSTTLVVQSAVTEARATGKIEVTVNLSGIFADASVSAIKYGPGLTVATQTASTFVGSTITDTTKTLATQTAATFAGLKRKPGVMSNSVATATDFDPNIIYGPSLSIAAVTVKLTTIRMVFQGDPFLFIKVPAENRQISVPVENRITLIDSENRVNMIKADTRTVLVPEETRRIKLRIPPISNALSTPRVRSEA